jgi:Ran GTPase-activating protein (RanGAP) involved in mRNA processing and transport
MASSAGKDIALRIRQSAEFLRPLWPQQPFVFKASPTLEDDVIPTASDEDDHHCFDRTLVAYCAGYDIDTSNIRYSIDYVCEDAPCFKLLLPATPRRQRYTALELLAVFRALRYNESFTSISFNGINLDILQELRDLFGTDPDATSTRAGTRINITGQESLTILSQEIRALALKSKRLRRLDFSFCLSRTPTTEKGVHDPGCGIPEAIFPLCRRQLTNVDWLVLNGIKLGDSDLDYLVDAASQRFCHLRALEISNCGISVHDLDIILSTIAAQENTLEAIDISGAQGRISPELFQQQIGYFGHIRKLNLSRIQKTAGPEPLIAPETLMTWRLEELSLSQTSVNEQTVDSISAYLVSSRSDTLKELHLDQCGLTGKDVTVFLQSMSRDDGKVRNLHLHVSENRLHNGYSLLFDAIAQNKTSSHLTMRMVEFQKEDHFRQLVEALRKNRSLKYLDISKASLPYDAGTETCELLQKTFEENQTLEELDISGEYAHLEVARFGIGLNLALTGLKKNKSLKVLRIEHQKLGLQGANTLATVLEENDSLVEVYCENNEMNLQSFTVLLNGLQKNTTLLYLPSMDYDRRQSLERVQHEIQAMNIESSNIASTKGPLRRTLTSAVAKGSRPVVTQSPTPPAYTEQDVQAAMTSLNDKWDAEVARLHRYLERNLNVAQGIPTPQGEAEEVVERPATASSLSGLLETVKLDRTPTLEKEVGLGDGPFVTEDLDRTPPAKKTSRVGI